MNKTILSAISILGTQKKLALACRVSQRAVSKWLNEESQPTADNAVAIEKATNGAVRRVDILPDVFAGMTYAETPSHE